ncbi:phosphoadenosine phosphosulfate reductase family protein [Actinophytocola sp.]|uniref:phosphoadenosine phosphosulfate reductase domain-containing protein n=1 Tax=Actinophytocola sp. TaxID=1872138 RepID=UPI003D6BB99A
MSSTVVDSVPQGTAMANAISAQGSLRTNYQSPRPACGTPCGVQPALSATAAAAGLDWEAHDVVVVGNSGGKDSALCLDTVCRQADAAGALHKVRVLHCDLGSTPNGHLVEWPGAEDVARRQATRYGVPFAVRRSSRWPSLFDRILSRGRWPGHFARYCTSELKTAVGRDYIDELAHAMGLGRPIRVGYALGMRAEESTARAKKPILERHRMTATTKRIVDTWLPIHHLTETQVWSTIHAQSLLYHPAYDQGMRRNIDRTTARHTRVSALVTSVRSIGLMQPSWRRLYELADRGRARG